MTDQREINARNLRDTRQKLEQLDQLIKQKANELKALRKEKKEAETRIEALTSSLNSIGDHSFDSPNAKFDSDSFPWSKELYERLVNVFNIQSFRGLQKVVINCTLSNNDCIYLAATGSGKSLVFQLTSLISNGITIVVSPLLSLMEDQVSQLDELGIPSKVLNKSTSKEDYKTIMKSMIDPESSLKLIYLTPEKLAMSKSIMAQIEKMYKAGRFSRLVIDEVHCCSQWGHDFRRDYNTLSVFKRQFPNTPIIGLTATATTEVIYDIQKILNIEGCYIFKSSFYRPNLKYEIRSTSMKENINDLVDIIQTRFRNQTGIVYCLSVKDTEDTAKKLTQLGVRCLAYHAQLDTNKRTDIQRKWYTNKCRVIAATVAFGLGINKTDVRFVVHYSMSKSIENYYQETGRAGRDGNPAYCICYYRFADVFRVTSLTFTNRNGQKLAYQMLAFCLNREECRKRLISDYFEDSLKKDPHDKQCCDNCSDNLPVSKLDVRDCLEDLLIILRHAAGKNERMTPNKLLDAWTQTKGPKNLRIEGLRKPSLSRSECESVLGLLIIDSFLKEDFHITPYNTISYIIPGPRADFGLNRALIYKLSLEDPGHLIKITNISTINNSPSKQNNKDSSINLCDQSDETQIIDQTSNHPLSRFIKCDIIKPEMEPEIIEISTPKRAKTERFECFTID